MWFTMIWVDTEYWLELDWCMHGDYFVIEKNEGDDLHSREKYLFDYLSLVLNNLLINAERR